MFLPQRNWPYINLAYPILNIFFVTRVFVVFLSKRPCPWRKVHATADCQSPCRNVLLWRHPQPFAMAFTGCTQIGKTSCIHTCSSNWFFSTLYFFSWFFFLFLDLNLFWSFPVFFSLTSLPFFGPSTTQKQHYEKVLTSFTPFLFLFFQICIVFRFSTRLFQSSDR